MNALTSSTKNLLLCILLLSGLSSCYTNINKQLDREVHVRISPNLPVTVNNTGNSNFSGEFTQADYTAKFLEGLKAEFGTSNIVIDELNPEFEVTFTQFTITESTTNETVNDTTSEDHGTVFELSKLDLSANGNVVRLKDGASYTWSASKSKDEDVKSSRTAGQIISGENQEKNQYREKEFDTDEAAQLSVVTGRRSATTIVKEIFKALK